MYRCSHIGVNKISTSDQTIPMESSLIDRVAAFLSNIPDQTTEMITDKKTVQARITVAEFAPWRESIRSCSNIAQLYVVVRKINKSQPGMKGMKRCLLDLKALKSAQNIGTNSSCRRRDKMELLQRGIMMVETFFDVNLADCIKAGW